MLHFPSLMLLVLTLLAAPVAATHAEERVQHYEAQKPKNMKQALELLSQRAETAEQSLKQRQLEGVHEQSYTLEAAIDFVNAHLRQQQKAADAIDEAVQEIHALSEKGDAAGVSNALPRLKQQTKTLQLLTQCQ